MSSVVEMECPNCAKALRVPPAVFGKKIKCKHCGHAFVVRDPAEGPARPAKGAKPAPSPPAAAAKNRFEDDDEDDARQIDVIREEDVARCPHCAKELDPPDAKVCIHCGFNNLTRAKAETKKVYAPDAMDWFQHLLPGVAALAIVIGFLVLDVISLLNMRDWLEGSFLEMEDKDAAGRKKYFVAPGFFICIIFAVSLAVCVPASKYAWKRLVNEFRPPEKVKK